MSLCLRGGYEEKIYCHCNHTRKTLIPRVILLSQLSLRRYRLTSMYKLKGGAVPIPRWILIFRTFQLLFALITISLTAYALSVYSGGPVRSPKHQYLWHISN